jgi:hypothetical protein
LAQPGEENLAEVVRIVWTAGHLAAVERLETTVIDASRVAGALWNPPRLTLRGWLRKATSPVG